MKRSSDNPLLCFLEKQTTVILDGGLATTLEDMGYDLDDDLWSTRVLIEDPKAVGRVHRDFLAAGADCITTATYQASLPGLEKRGFDPAQARAQFDVSVDLAVAARNEFWSQPENRVGRQKPLVAASVGPYGAFLADGSEYLGNYGINEAALENFHRKRWAILAGSQADLLACETLPSYREAAVLLELLHDTPDRWAWFSFSCRSGTHLCDGVPFSQAVELCTRSPRVAAIGVNCTAPEFISPLLTIARGITDKPLIVYPNSGEIFDPAGNIWRPAPCHLKFTELVAEWAAHGATVIGGCCRIGPKDIAELRGVLLD